MKLKEVVKTEVADRRKAGFGLPIQMFVALMVIALAFFALLYLFAPGHGQNLGLQSAPVFGVVVSPDMLVVAVDPGGIAENSGVKAGDKLAKVDGQPVTSLDDAKNKLVDDLFNQKEVTLTVLRNNQSLDLKLKPGTSANPGGPTPTPLPQGFGYF